MKSKHDKARIRLQNLMKVISYARKFKPNHFSSGQMICLHSECAAQHRVIDNIDDQPSYVLPDHLEAKFQDILTWIGTD